MLEPKSLQNACELLSMFYIKLSWVMWCMVYPVQIKPRIVMGIFSIMSWSLFWVQAVRCTVQAHLQTAARSADTRCQLAMLEPKSLQNACELLSMFYIKLSWVMWCLVYPVQIKPRVFTWPWQKYLPKCMLMISWFRVLWFCDFVFSWFRDFVNALRLRGTYPPKAPLKLGGAITTPFWSYIIITQNGGYSAPGIRTKTICRNLRGRGENHSRQTW